MNFNTKLVGHVIGETTARTIFMQRCSNSHVQLTEAELRAIVSAAVEAALDLSERLAAK